MKPRIKAPLQSIKKVFRKEKIHPEKYDPFVDELNKYLKSINEGESEEYNKKLIIDFLQNTFYPNRVNTKDRIDLAIYSESKKDKSFVEVIIETKKPSNKGEMITIEDVNRKAMWEVLLYYLRERVLEENNDLKQIIITNNYEWFIFDAQVFENEFYQNKKLISEFNKWNDGEKTSSNTDLFYKEIAKKYLDSNPNEIECTYFNLKEYETLIESKDDKEKKVRSLYRIFSDTHLLKRPFANDSNTLDKKFYDEFLHILGLEEKKEKSKKLIQRKEEKSRNPHSLLEETIRIVNRFDLNKIINLEQFGTDEEKRVFNIGLELCITWMNRILFLKLLEAQLIRYHRNNKDYQFLNIQTIRDFGELEILFFDVLAKKTNERDHGLDKKFQKIPYLNSSLFDISELESLTTRISSLSNYPIAIYNQTVLKSNTGKKRDGEANLLEYFFEFLDAYDFSSEGTDEIQEDKKTLISASVLGLMFEKINGYKDGSYYTPGFITMYMCRETIRRAVLQKFSEEKGWEFDDNNDLDENIKKLKVKIGSNTKEANEIINSLKICDPAVGSGHFLVSALNEIIAIKFDLNVLCLTDGSTFKNNDCKVLIEHDQLIISFEHSHEIFEYQLSEQNRPITRLQELQETLFYEKKGIIENCLFGVDINTNSVQICRLRLWIELLKNAFYTQESDYQELETLPNIDINIKQGNSLISMYDTHQKSDTLSAADRQKVKEITDQYKPLINDYKECFNRSEKKEIIENIKTLKNQFKDLASSIDSDYKEMRVIKGKLNEQMLVETDKEIDKRNKLKEKLRKLESKYNEKRETIYKSAFEWRFEFPEVLNDVGDFVGFDVVIGNPPYGIKLDESIQKSYGLGSKEIYGFFIILAISLLREQYSFSYIVSDTWLTIKSHFQLREKVLEHQLEKIIRLHQDCFDVTVNTCILILKKDYIKTDTEHLIIAGDLTNLSTQKDLPQFLRILFKLEKNIRIRTKEYAVYQYPQNLLYTNSNKPIIVGSPKLFELMRDVDCKTVKKEIGDKEKKEVNVRQVEINGKTIELIRFGEIAEVKVGLQTGDNKYYLYQNPNAHRSYKDINQYKQYLLSDNDLSKIRNNEELRLEVVEKGIHKSPDEESFNSNRYFEGRYIAPYDKGGESDTDEGWLPNYYVSTDYFIDYSTTAIDRLNTLTTKERNSLYGKPGGNDKLCSRFQNKEYYFSIGLTYSRTGNYAPTFRLNNFGPFDSKSNFVETSYPSLHLGFSNSKLIKYIFKVFICQTVQAEGEDVKEIQIPFETNQKSIIVIVKNIIKKQKQNPRYDYASHEQKEIDQLVYELYGLNDEDIKEVEIWFARRYPKLAKYADIKDEKIGIVEESG